MDTLTLILITKLRINSSNDQHSDEVRGIRQGEKLILWNDLAEVSVFANVTDDVINGVLVVSHGFWRRHVKGNTVNALVHSKPSAIGQGITVNDTMVFIKKYEDTPG